MKLFLEESGLVVHLSLDYVSRLDRTSFVSIVREYDRIEKTVSDREARKAASREMLRWLSFGIEERDILPCEIFEPIMLGRFRICPSRPGDEAINP